MFNSFTQLPHHLSTVPFRFPVQNLRARKNRSTIEAKKNNDFQRFSGLVSRGVQAASPAGSMDLGLDWVVGTRKTERLLTNLTTFIMNPCPKANQLSQKLKLSTSMPQNSHQLSDWSDECDGRIGRDFLLDKRRRERWEKRAHRART